MHSSKLNSSYSIWDKNNCDNGELRKWIQKKVSRMRKKTSKRWQTASKFKSAKREKDHFVPKRSSTNDKQNEWKITEKNLREEQKKLVALTFANAQYCPNGIASTQYTKKK